MTHPSSSGSGGDKQKKGGFDKINYDHNDSTYGGGGSSVAVLKGLIVEEEEEEAAGTGNRKRKRKRPGKKNTEDSVETATPVVTAPPTEKQKPSVKVEAPTPIVSHNMPPLKVAAISTGERNIDMRKIQKLRSGKVTSLTALGDEIESMAKKSKSR